MKVTCINQSDYLSDRQKKNINLEWLENCVPRSKLALYGYKAPISFIEFYIKHHTKVCLYIDEKNDVLYHVKYYKEKDELIITLTRRR